MLELIFIDLPIGISSYFAIVFLIMKYMGDQVHNVGSDVATSSDQSQTNLSASPKPQEPPTSRAENSVQAAIEPDPSRPEHLPSDSVLVRHHLTHLIALANEAQPLAHFKGSREAYQDRVRSLVEGMLKDPAQITALELERFKYIQSNDVPTSEPVIVESVPVAANEPFSYLPEDATLRRHTLQLIVSRLEEHYPRPTDSTLIRHYEQWVDSELEKLKDCA